ncbi:MAG: PAS domain-containing protein [Alphaproteobacteria bacterium]|jgi:hypothetical protein|uniref:PAS domain-containing protein n=1 Tax=Pacificispira sp. TaxID=2888761 RepID=UPI001B19636D|nr:PAS domain-containing protein [Alphaproteobacteria bacterium]MBO6861502.1 PAS domain-containing protein [Alphaproteobacteria bacterium]
MPYGEIELFDTEEFERLLERSELVTAFRYWRSISGDRPLPTYEDLDPLDIIPILPLVNLVDVVPQTQGGYRFRHRLVGTELVDRFRTEHTGQWFEDLYDAEHLERQLPSYIRAVERRKPTVGDIELSENGKKIMAYRRLILPLAGPDGAVNCLLLVFAFQSEEDRFRPLNEGLPLHRQGQGSRRG